MYFVPKKNKPMYFHLLIRLGVLHVILIDAMEYITNIVFFFLLLLY